MSKLTKQQLKLHNEACDLLQKDTLTIDERYFVIENWHEGATHDQTSAGAFFTPRDIAQDVAMHASGARRVIDLCAGIGGLAFALLRYHAWSNNKPEIVCVEKNPDYVAVGKKFLPEAMWIEADVFDLPSDLTGFDCAISNPPFGKRVRTVSAKLKYPAEYEVIRVASRIAASGVFVLPQSSAPFRLSGVQSFSYDVTCPQYEQFSSEYGIKLEPNCGIDTSGCANQWRGTRIITEIALAQFDNAPLSRGDLATEEDSFEDLPLFTGMMAAA